MKVTKDSTLVFSQYIEEEGADGEEVRTIRRTDP